MRRFVVFLFRIISRTRRPQSANAIHVIAGRPKSAEFDTTHDRSHPAGFAVIRGALPEHGQPHAG